MIYTISSKCSQFLTDSNKLPLIKYLPRLNDGFRKVKLRKKKLNDGFAEIFNSIFPEYKNLLNRSLLVSSQTNHSLDTEPFYIFPINGYKFIYNPFVENTSIHFSNIFDNLSKNLEFDDINQIISEQVKDNYISDNLVNAIHSKCEIIFYKIPYYYAIRKSLVDDYKKVIYD